MRSFTFFATTAVAYTLLCCVYIPAADPDADARAAFAFAAVREKPSACPASCPCGCDGSGRCNCCQPKADRRTPRRDGLGFCSGACSCGCLSGGPCDCGSTRVVPVRQAYQPQPVAPASFGGACRSGG